MIARQQKVDVTFVIDAISRFGAGGEAAREFNVKVKDFKKAQMDLAVTKLKEDFRDQIKGLVGDLNDSMTRQDKDAGLHAVTVPIENSGFANEGVKYTKRHVLVDSTLSGDIYEDYEVRMYQSFTNRLESEKYLNETVLTKIKGSQTKFELLLEVQKEQAQNDFRAMQDGFTKHLGEGVQSVPTAYNDSGPEITRTSGDMAYVSMKEAAGREAASKSVLEKPISKDVRVSIGQIAQTGLSVAVSLTCSPIVAAALNAGMSMAGTTMDYANGKIDSSQFGLGLLKNAISGGASILTAGMMPSSGIMDFGTAMLSAGINTGASIATTGLKLNANGQLDWQLTQQEWATMGITAATSFGSAAFNSGINWKGDSMKGLGYLQAAGNWAINTTGSTINRGWKTTATGGIDWQMNSDDWAEAGMDIATSGIKSALDYGMSGYTGYGKNNRSMFNYVLDKGLDIGKYQMYKEGVFGNGLREKYANENAFDLAGGIDLTVYQNQHGAASLRLTTKGVQLHSGEGEFGGFAMNAGPDGSLSWNGNDTLKSIGIDTQAIGQFIGNIGKSMMPWGQQTPAQEAVRELANQDFVTEEERRKKLAAYSAMYAQSAPSEQEQLLLNAMIASHTTTQKELKMLNAINKDAGGTAIDPGQVQDLMTTLSRLPVEARLAYAATMQVNNNAVNNMTEVMFKKMTGSNSTDSDTALWREIRGAIASGDTQKLAQIEARGWQNATTTGYGSLNYGGTIAFPTGSNEQQYQNNLLAGQSYTAAYQQSLIDDKANWPQMSAYDPSTKMTEKQFQKRLAFLNMTGNQEQAKKEIDAYGANYGLVANSGGTGDIMNPYNVSTVTPEMAEQIKKDQMTLLKIGVVAGSGFYGAGTAAFAGLGTMRTLGMIANEMIFANGNISFIENALSSKTGLQQTGNAGNLGGNIVDKIVLKDLLSQSGKLPGWLGWAGTGMSIAAAASYYTDYKITDDQSSFRNAILSGADGGADILMFGTKYVLKMNEFKNLSQNLLTEKNLYTRWQLAQEGMFSIYTKYKNEYLTSSLAVGYNLYTTYDFGSNQQSSISTNKKRRQ